MSNGTAAAGQPSQAREEGLSERAVGGFGWSVAQKWVARISGFVTIAILTRLLAPSDFGVVAIALSILPLLQLLADLGFSTYVLQVKELTSRTLSTVFWYSSGAGLILMAGLIALAPLVGVLLNTPEAVDVIRGLAPVAACVTLGAVPTVLLRRLMRFRALAIQSVIASIVGQVVAVVLAVVGLGVWALVWQSLAYTIVVNVLAWAAARWHPTFEFSRTEFVAMSRFGVQVVGIELVAIGRAWLENAIIVSALGTTGLGYMAIAQRLILIAQDLTTSALAPVSLVVFAQIRETPTRLRSAYVRAQGASYTLVIPVMLFIAIGGPWLIPLVFGSGWETSVAPAQALAVAGILVIGASLDHGLFYGLGRPGAWFVYALVVDALTVLMTLLMAPNGLLAIALGFVGVAAAATAARLLLVGRLLETPWWRVSGPIGRAIPPAVAAAAAGIGVAIVAQELVDLAVLALVGVAIVAAYVPIVRVASRPTWNELVGILRRVLRKRSRRPEAVIP